MSGAIVYLMADVTAAASWLRRLPGRSSRRCLCQSLPPTPKPPLPLSSPLPVLVCRHTHRQEERTFFRRYSISGSCSSSSGNSNEYNVHSCMASLKVHDPADPSAPEAQNDRQEKVTDVDAQHVARNRRQTSFFLTEGHETPCSFDTPK